MAEVALPITPAKLTGYELMKVINNRFYTKKIHNNPEFYEKEKQRVREYLKNRYINDPDYAEMKKQKSRERYLAKKLKLQEEAKPS